MCRVHYAALVAMFGVSLTSQASEPQRQKEPAPDPKPSRLLQSVTGPRDSLNAALGTGPTIILTLQPVQPKTVPASNYPPGSAIMGQTLTLGSVPARVWIQTELTGWAPDLLRLRVFALALDATDNDMDGGGYLGSRANCGGLPMSGAGDLGPAMQPCVVNADCDASMSGGTCNIQRSSRCVTYDGTSPGSYFPPGKYCEFGFWDRCDPKFIATNVASTLVFDLSTINTRWGGNIDPGELLTDYMPCHAGVIVVDVPGNAKGTYRLDFDNTQTYLQNDNPPGQNDVPIAAINMAVIQVECGSCCTNFSTTGDCTDGLSQAECDTLPTSDARVFRPGTSCDQAPCCDCLSNMDCADNDACTVDACVDSCYCSNTPVAGWNPATECCHPMSGVQAMIPLSTSCRTGACSLGGSSGVPTYIQVANGTSCSSMDPCTGNGTCQDGACVGAAYAGKDCPKPRFISFNAGAATDVSAYRIRLVSLHHPDPPYTGAPTADFSMHEGEVRWVGAPRQYIESSADFTAVYASLSQCQPHYQSWSGLDPLHVTGGEIVPSSVYEVQSIAQGLDINNEANYSAPVTIATARWGESVIPYAPPATVVQPDASDISEILDKFRSANDPISKPRAMLTGPGMGGVPDLNADVNFTDVGVCVDANRGKGYPYPWPADCP